MAPPDPFAVKVALLEGGEPKTLGSGAILAPRVVLTARHVLKNCPLDQLCVRPHASARPVKVAALLPTDDDGLDVVVLLVEADLIGPMDGRARLVARALANAEDWAASGYPAIVNSAPSEALHTVAGQTLPTAEDADKVELDVRRGPKCWGGLSGAAVRIGEEVVAVVRSVPEGWDGGRLTATPVGKFERAPWLLQALGVGDADEQLRDEVTRLLDELRALIEPCAFLRRALVAAGCATTDDASALAGALVGGRADRVVAALNQADEDLDEDRAPPADREALWQVLERVLPHTIDWKQTITLARKRVLECRCLGQPEPAQFELSCRTEVVAEIVLAGVDGRRCAFVPMGERLAGVGFLAWPAASLVPIRQSPDAVREAIVQKLASELGISVEAASVVEQLATDTKTPTTGHAKGILSEIESRLAVALQSRRSNPRRRHLLVIDDEHGGPEAGLRAWEVARSALGARLPTLRLVRLTGDPEQRGPETLITAPVEALYRARNSG